MEALHFAFGLGAFVSPLIAEPFLSTGHQIGINVTNMSFDFNVTSPFPAQDPLTFALLTRNPRAVRSLLNDSEELDDSEFESWNFSSTVIMQLESTTKTAESPRKPMLAGTTLNNDESIASGKKLKDHLQSLDSNAETVDAEKEESTQETDSDKSSAASTTKSPQSIDISQSNSTEPRTTNPSLT